MRRTYLVTGLGLALLAAASLATFVQGDSSSQTAPQASEAGASLYAEDLPGVRTGAVDSAQRRLNSAVLNRYLGRGQEIRLRAGTRLEIGSSLKIASGGAIIGDREGPKPTIYMPPSSFDNIDAAASAGRYAANAVGINFSSTGPQPSHGVRIENVRLASEQKSNRLLRGIVGQNVTGCAIRDVEIANFPTGVGIALASARGCRISDIHVHDFHDDRAWPTLAQSTGIEVDNDIVNGVTSADTLIERFTIERLKMSGPLLKKWGYQTDGINILNSGSKVDIRTGRISDVGEGIDTFGSNGTIADVAISNTDLFGVKFIHGASGNVARNISITNAGLAGINFSGSEQASRNTAGNIVSDLKIKGIDPTGMWKQNETAGILVSGLRSRHVPVDNQVIRAEIDLGAHGKYAWVDKSTGRRNRALGVRITAGRSLVEPALVLHGATDQVNILESSR